jgi:hypothetical protein
MAQSREETSLSIGPYHVYRGDELNWFVTRAGHATRYFTTLPDALTWLLRVRTGDRPGRQLADVLRAVDDANAEILKAIEGLALGGRTAASETEPANGA